MQTNDPDSDYDGGWEDAVDSGDLGEIMLERPDHKGPSGGRDAGLFSTRPGIRNRKQPDMGDCFAVGNDDCDVRLGSTVLPAKAVSTTAQQPTKPSGAATPAKFSEKRLPAPTVRSPRIPKIAKRALAPVPCTGDPRFLRLVDSWRCSCGWNTEVPDGTAPESVVQLHPVLRLGSTTNQDRVQPKPLRSHRLKARLKQERWGCARCGSTTTVEPGSEVHDHDALQLRASDLLPGRREPQARAKWVRTDADVQSGGPVANAQAPGTRHPKAQKHKVDRTVPVSRSGQRPIGALKVRNPLPMPYLCTGVLRFVSKVDCWQCSCGWTCETRAGTNLYKVTEHHGPQKAPKSEGRVSIGNHNRMSLEHRVTRNAGWELWSCADCRWADVVRPHTSRHAHCEAAEKTFWDVAGPAPKPHQPSPSELAGHRRKQAFELGLPMHRIAGANAPKKPAIENRGQSQSKPGSARPPIKVPASNPGALGSPSTVCSSCGGPIRTDGRCRCS